MERTSSNDHKEVEDEALSLCDFPVDKEQEVCAINAEEKAEASESDEEFDFGSLGGSFRPESEMCAADEVFFQGQILPLRHSFSSEKTLNCLKPDTRLLTRSLSRSGSLDRVSSSGFTSSAASSRSSSTRSHQSSSTSSNSPITRKYNPRTRNRFVTHPSPRPQLNISRKNPNPKPNPKASAWEFLRLGPGRAPDIEWQDLKVRSSRRRSALTGKEEKERFFDWRMLGGCKFSVETIPLNVVASKGGSVISKNHDQWTERHAMEEKLRELKIKEKKQGKQEMSRHRTFEWIKDL